jgi:broad specificity phosphatase PhoE
MAESIKSSGTRILLIRHGETDWNRIHRFQGRSDIPLNQKGREQARALALALKHEPIMAIYSSPLVRAIETARLIKMFHFSTPFFEEEALVEMDLGDFDGMEAKRWAAQFQDFRKAWQENPESVKMPGGESLKDVQTRAIDALERITNIYPPGSTLLICSHNFVNLTIVCHALEISLNRFRDLQQDTAAISVLYKQGYRLWAEIVNDRSHLQKYKENQAW